ncbi:hypothetical protein A2U01_0055590, partial [Trifolium medium]|nr:hypothetical protein [Trifolium medium]
MEHTSDKGDKGTQATKVSESDIMESAAANPAKKRARKADG